jgi:hypothetical protein
LRWLITIVLIRLDITQTSTLCIRTNATWCVSGLLLVKPCHATHHRSIRWIFVRSIAQIPFSRSLHWI